MSINKPSIAPKPTDSEPSRSPLLRLLSQPRIVVPALKVALVVGSILNLINSGEKLWNQHSINLWQVGLNFVVPFCVSSYSAARNDLRRQRGE
ncbi:nitrate/nitrite transporter NrtS [Polaromonas sp.]|uniref:nitrate/nitrite transporter NrtS n=1 Tax=Polaromonas sp. TaxID=1869339 RepID=UPI0035659B31